MKIGKSPKPLKRPKKIPGLEYQFGEILMLPKPLLEDKLSFFEVINLRRSGKNFSELSLQQLSNLLWYSAKVKKIISVEKGHILSQRYAPSAGAIHPIDILISLPEPTINQRTLFYYDPFNHRLCKLIVNKRKLSIFFIHINKGLSLGHGTMLWLIGHSNRTESFYENADSLIWRDAGVLAALIQLVSTALKLQSCPIGSLGEPYFSRIFKTESMILSAGGILVG